MTTKKENEQLVKLQTDMSWVIKLLNNHLQHHWYATGILLTALVALAVAFLKMSFWG